MIHEIVFIGDKFYNETSSRMSPVYMLDRNGTYARTDWGRIQFDLQNNIQVFIRPATEKEMNFFKKELKKMKVILKKQGWSYERGNFKV